MLLEEMEDYYFHDELNVHDAHATLIYLWDDQYLLEVSVMFTLS